MHHVRRRDFVDLLGSAAAWPAVAFAQSPERVRRAGVLMTYAADDPNGQIQVQAFRGHLRTLDWVQGSNVTVDARYARGNPARAQEEAIDLLQKMVSKSNLVTTILQTEIRTIPLVFISVSDPVGSGFVKELARPGGNIPGFANFLPSMGGKWLENMRQHRRSSALDCFCTPSRQTSDI
jgi:putative ABC transport system substrate-binding protein